MNAYTLAEKAAIAIEAATYRNNLENSSARLCLRDAEWCYQDGKYAIAFRRALKSLAYGVSVHNPIYAEIAELYAGISEDAI